MIKVFASVPMKGRSAEEIREEQKHVFYAYFKTRLTPEKKELLDTVCPDHDGKGAVWCLGWSLQKMDEADVVLFAKGWEDARGCRIEHEVAKTYDCFDDVWEVE